MKERDIEAVQADAEDVKNTVQRLARRKTLFIRVFTCRGVGNDWRKLDEFRSPNPRTPKTTAKKSKAIEEVSFEEDDWYDSFSNLIDECVNDNHVTAIRVTARSNHAEEIDKFVEKYINEKPTVIQTDSDNSVTQNNMNDFNKMLFGAFTGLDPASINEGNAQSMLFGAAVSLNKQSLQSDYNSKIKDLEHAAEIKELKSKQAIEELNHKLGATENECSKLKEQIKAMEGEKSKLEDDKKKLEDELNKALDTVDAAKEEIAKRESLRPENSIMGVSLAGLGSMICQNLIRQNAGVIDKVMGAPSGSFLGMLDAQQAAAATPVTPAVAEGGNATPEEFTIEEEDERSADIEKCTKAMRELNDTDFQEVVNFITEYAQNKEEA